MGEGNQVHLYEVINTKDLKDFLETVYDVSLRGYTLSTGQRVLVSRGVDLTTILQFKESGLRPLEPTFFYDEPGHREIWVD